MSPPPALSRTCNLADFDSCWSVAAWQQKLAEQAWQRWESELHIRTRAGGLCVNWSGCHFIAPGPEATYHYPSEKETNHLEELPAIYGLGVLDRVQAPVRFLSKSVAMLRTRGLLVLTFAFWDAQGDDIAEGNAARRRIYDAHHLQKLIAEARRVGFQGFGGIDWAYRGDKLDDHSLASLVLTKR